MAASPPLLAEDRRNRLIAAPFAMPAADERRSRKERAVKDDAAASLQEVSLQEPGFGMPSDPVDTADGTGTTVISSLRDRMPHPAF